MREGILLVKYAVRNMEGIIAFKCDSAIRSFQYVGLGEINGCSDTQIPQLQAWMQI